MTVKDEKGRILVSRNPVITEMWKEAKYEEVKEKETKRKTRNTQKK